jgi:PAP2 superfamily
VIAKTTKSDSEGALPALDEGDLMTTQDRRRRWTWRLATVAVATVIGPIFVAAPASAQIVPANPVITWNANAQTAIWDVARENPWVQSRSFAMVQGAVYDAVNAIAGRPYEPYLVAPPASGSESTDAAVATAAHRVLLSLFPAQRDRLVAEYERYLAGIPNGGAKQRGIAIGGQAAAAMIAARQNDGAFGNEPFPTGTQPGQWRPVPPTFGNVGAWVANLRPFFIASPSAYRTAGPPALTSNAYARDFNEVKQIGAVNSATRTADQTDAARWWHDRRLTQWEISRQLATTQRLTVVQTARMMALVYLTTADATTACFNEKHRWGFWRPVTAIQLADTDGNPATAPDPAWMPVLITPGSPDYTSGHGCYTGSAMVILRLFFGRDTIPFSATSADTGTTRNYSSFSQALTELIDARVWGGIHFRTADVQGAWVGTQVSLYLFTHRLRPVR